VSNLVPLQAIPNQDIIQKLERLLEKAREGEIQAVACVGLLPSNGSHHVMWSMGNRSVIELVGALESLKADLLKTIWEQ
jgi:hypothetical protein